MLILYTYLLNYKSFGMKSHNKCAVVCGRSIVIHLDDDLTPVIGTRHVVDSLLTELKSLRQAAQRDRCSAPWASLVSGHSHVRHIVDAGH